VFTIEQIDDVHDRLGTAETLADYVRALRALGVERYDSYLTDGHSEYFGKDDRTVVSPPVHEPLAIADTSDHTALLEHLRLHNEHKTTYVETSKGLAASGIVKWTVDTTKMTMSFRDGAGNALLVEPIA
jgi:uncharacterized protein YbcV (DUF1398 family)